MKDLLKAADDHADAVECSLDTLKRLVGLAWPDADKLDVSALCHAAEVLIAETERKVKDCRRSIEEACSCEYPHLDVGRSEVEVES